MARGPPVRRHAGSRAVRAPPCRDWPRLFRQVSRLKANRVDRPDILPRASPEAAAAADGGVDRERRHHLPVGAADRRPPCCCSPRSPLSPGTLATRLRLPPHRPSAVTLALVLAGVYLTLERVLVAQPGDGACRAGHVLPVHPGVVFHLQHVAGQRRRRLARDGDRALRGHGDRRRGVVLRDLQPAMDPPDLDVARAGAASEAPRHDPGGRVGDVSPVLSDQSQHHGDDLPVLAHRARDLPRGSDDATAALVACRARSRRGGRSSAPSTPRPRSPSSAPPSSSPPFNSAPAATRRVIAWAWAGAIMLVVPLATLAYHSQLYLSAWIPHSAQHRIVIWGYTSSQIAKAPILGSGINTARALNDPEGYDAPLAPGSDFRLTTGLHSHNVYLQAWYETGAVGALLLLAIGLLVLQLVGAGLDGSPALPLRHLRDVCALLGGTSFSLWQPWFMASFGFAAGFAMLGWALADRSRAQERERS